MNRDEDIVTKGEIAHYERQKASVCFYLIQKTLNISVVNNIRKHCGILILVQCSRINLHINKINRFPDDFINPFPHTITCAADDLKNI